MPIDWLFRNPSADKQAAYSAAERDVLSLQRLAEAETALAQCPAHRATPLYTLPALASELDIGGVLFKDESHRFGFGAFKALGGVYALGRQLQKIIQVRTGVAPSLNEIVSGRHAAIVSGVTATAASSGNHGRAVAAGARLFGSRCMIFLPAFTSPEKEALIRLRGADVVRVDGDYDTALEQCRRQADRQGWLLVSDTSWPGYNEIPRDVMQGYGVIAMEIDRQLPVIVAPGRPSHVMLQAGVGGLAAAVAGTFRERWHDRRPDVVVVEPETADCFLQTARAGRPAPASGDAATAMGGLACREISPDAWTILRTAADWFCTVREQDIGAALRRLAAPGGDDRPLAVGPSGIAGLMGLIRIAGNDACRHAVRLDRRSIVVLIGSEGAAGDRQYFKDATGHDAAAIVANGLAWDVRFATEQLVAGES